MGSLAASFFSTNADSNFVTPGDTAKLKFTNPLVTASDVVITVTESIVFLNSGNAAVTDRLVGEFKGQLNQGVLQVQSIRGAPLPTIKDPVLFNVAADDSPGAAHLIARMPEPEQVQNHTLRLRIVGKVKGITETFPGASLLQVEYPMAMVIGRQIKNPHDQVFNFVGSWAKDQWIPFKPKFRFVQEVTPLRLFRDITVADYDELNRAIIAAAKQATSGVVALTTGHGDGGQSQPNGVPWCNLVPEDFPPPIDPAPFLYKLDIQDDILAEGATQGQFPTDPRKIAKLRALDQLADGLVGTGIRRILLHTCHAGSSTRFMQLLADRVRVPLLAHTESIEYIGFPGSGSMIAHYEGETPVTPRDLRHWPVAHVAGPFFPGPAPKRF
jgi:hypothetical protein